MEDAKQDSVMVQASAPTTTTGTSSTTLHELDLKLQEQLRYWQQRLRLQDWIVELKIRRARDIDQHFGLTTSSLQNKRALIELMDPVDHDPVRQIPYDMESTLVHELLHLHFRGMDPEKDSPQEIVLEQAINLIAHAMTGKL